MRTAPLAAVLFVSLPLTAQQLPPLTVGDTIRLFAPELHLKRARATFGGWTDTTLVVHLVRGNGTTAIPFSELRRIEVYRGKNRLKGGLMGGAIGASLGALLGGLMGKAAVSGCQEFLCELDAIGYMGVGMVVGAIPGAAVGATALAPDRWERLDLPPGLGFAPDPTPFHQTIGFRFVAAFLSIAFIAATS